MYFNHGFLVLDKPTGISSAQAVAKVKHILNGKKIGHGGTLDPLASGVLPLAIGEATKAFDYVASSRKEYHFSITFGEERTTDDAEGAVTERTDVIPSIESLRGVLPEFMGTIMQVPPIYSALKVDGQRAYKMARAGETVVMEARPVEIYDLRLISAEERMATFVVECGKGTYVRSLARDIARKVNSLGYVSMLRRTMVGKFLASNAILLDNLQEFVHSAAPFSAWLPLELALDDIPAIELKPAEEARLRCGQHLVSEKPEGKYVVTCDGRLVAFGQVENGILRSSRGFNLNT